MAEGAAHLRSHVGWEKAIVMDHLMEEPMMAMLGVEENLSVAAITVKNLASTSMPKMTAVIYLHQLRQKGLQLFSFLGQLLSLLQVGKLLEDVCKDLQGV